MSRRVYIAGIAVALGLCAIVTLQAQDGENEPNSRNHWGDRLQMLILGGRPRPEQQSSNAETSRRPSARTAQTPERDEPAPPRFAPEQTNSSRRRFHPSDTDAATGETLRVQPVPGSAAAEASASDSGLVPNGATERSGPSGFAPRSSDSGGSSRRFPTGIERLSPASDSGSSSSRRQPAPRYSSPREPEAFPQNPRYQQPQESPSQRPSSEPEQKRYEFPSSQREPQPAKTENKKEDFPFFEKSNKPTDENLWGEYEKRTQQKYTPSTPARSRYNPANRRREDVLMRGQTPILVVETSGPRRVVLDKEATYRVAVKNEGNITANDVVVSIKVPAWAEIVGSDTHTAGFVSRPDKSANGVEWNIKRLDAKGQEAMTLRVIPHEGHPFDLSISIGQGALESQAAVEVAEPKLQMAIAGPNEALYGKLEVYKLTLSNPGSADAENVVLKLLPDSPGEEPPASHKIGKLRAGEKKVIELELTPRQGGNLKIKAMATDGNKLETTTEKVVLVRKPSLRVAVSGPKFRYARTAATYEIAVTNPGNAPARNVQVVALVPPGAKYLSAGEGGRYDPERGKVTWRFSVLDPEAERVVTWRCELGEPGVTRVQAASVADADLKDSTSTLTEVEAIADLSMTVRDPRGPIPVGEEIHYEVRVVNRGTKAAQNVSVASFLSAGLNPVSAQGGPKYRLNQGQISFDPIAVLGPGQEMTLQIKAVATTSGNHVFRAELRCDDLDISIAEEESTRFYSDDVNAGEPESQDDSDSGLGERPPLGIRR